MWALTACAAWWLAGISNSHSEWVVGVTEKLRFLRIWEFLNQNHPEGEHLNLSNSLSHPAASARLKVTEPKHRKSCFPGEGFSPSPTGGPSLKCCKLWFILKLFPPLFEQSWRCKTLKSRRTQRISSTQERQPVLKIKRLLIGEKTHKNKVQRK